MYNTRVQTFKHHSKTADLDAKWLGGMEIEPNTLHAKHTHTESYNFNIAQTLNGNSWADNMY